MAWWDHEELKSMEDRSDRYKREFSSEYSDSQRYVFLNGKWHTKNEVFWSDELHLWVLK